MPSQIQKATVQASILNVTSSVLAQLLQAYRKSSFPPSSSASSLYGLQLLPILQFLFWCLLSTPPNFMWQEFLEKHFPGYPAQRDKQKIKVDDGGKVCRVCRIHWRVACGGSDLGIQGSDHRAEAGCQEHSCQACSRSDRWGSVE